jgi:hypothetical protein
MHESPPAAFAVNARFLTRNKQLLAVFGLRRTAHNVVVECPYAAIG